LRLFIYPIPCIPSPFKGEGENKKEGLSPLLDTPDTGMEYERERSRTMNESQWTAKICKLIQGSDISSLKAIYSELSYKKSFETILKTYFGAEAPRFMAKPDLIMVFEDYSRKFEDYALIAIELKYFGLSPSLDKNLREASRQIGQALRYHLFGFDSAVLWHTFAEDVGDEIIVSYSTLIGEVFDKLELSLVYFSTKIQPDNSFKVYKPMNLQLVGSLDWLVGWMRDISLDKRNPLLHEDSKDQKVTERRRALKVALRVP